MSRLDFYQLRLKYPQSHGALLQAIEMAPKHTHGWIKKRADELMREWLGRDEGEL